MEIDILDILTSPFVWGLLLGLGLAFFAWRSGAKDKKFLKSELKRAQEEASDLQGHLNTQLKINAKGNEALDKELEKLKEQNENLRMNLNTLQQKPGKMDQRRLDVMEMAISVLREQAPGFAAAWEKAMREAEDDYEAGESGLKKLMRKVVPTFRSTAPTSDTKVIEAKESKGSE